MRGPVLTEWHITPYRRGRVFTRKSNVFKVIDGSTNSNRMDGVSSC
jgi:hypothetical protein